MKNSLAISYVLALKRLTLQANITELLAFHLLTMDITTLTVLSAVFQGSQLPVEAMAAAASFHGLPHPGWTTLPKDMRCE